MIRRLHATLALPLAVATSAALALAVATSTALPLAVATSAALVLALSTSTAHAQTAAPDGFSLEHTDPAPAGDRFFYVASGSVRGLFEVHGAIHRAYVRDPLPGVDAGGKLVDHRVGGHLDLTLALAKALMLNVDVPDVAFQTGDGDFDRSVEGGKLGDLRSTFRIAWLDPERKTLSLGTQVDVWYPTGSEDDFAGDRKARVRPMLALGGEAGPVAYAANGGYVFRPEVDPVGDGKVGPGPSFGAAVGLLLFDDTLQVGPEIFGQSTGGGASGMPLEGLFGVKVRAGDVVVGAAGGMGLTDGPGAADARAHLSFAFVRDERVPDPDGDGLTGPRDACPHDPGLTENGCPPHDGDGDTIADELDACPTERGLVHDDPRKHGCPPRGGAMPPP